ncbi:MAG: hypothetical protein CM15mP125_2840 [Gammaproteobacteria bacterium]|nr:MAG: hypothetical protein CM15mP125_2840 [Gammaproteobacteria bacterium]
MALEKADDGRSSVRLRRILSESLQVHALEQDKGLWCAPTSAPWSTGETQVDRPLHSRDRTPALRRRSRWPHWLRGESVLYAPARWQEDFEVFVVDVDLSTWEWQAARQLQQSVAVSP